jgi:hypothetical protein
MRGDAGKNAKEGTSCVVCGVSTPPSLGVKPRKYCSRRCTNAAYGFLPKPQSVTCRSCGKPVVQSGKGRTRWHCSSACRTKANHHKKVHKRHCKTCGGEFATFQQSKYCSEECRWPNRTAVRPCERCGVDFKQKHHASRFCSNSCSAASTFHLRPLARKPVVRKCSNCEIPFVRKKFKSGSYSVAKKYCCRECAFEARRLKKKCAERPLEIANRLATWFLSWGECERPKVRQCSSCGIRRLLGESEVCKECTRQSAPRECRSCGIAIPKTPGKRLCGECKDTIKKQRRREGRASRARNTRQRCKDFGATYTPIKPAVIYERDSWECQICGAALVREWPESGGATDPLSRTVDHIIPLDTGPNGPGHVSHNLIACCLGCNVRKSNKNPIGWACTLPRSPDSFALP